MRLDWPVKTLKSYQWMIFKDCKFVCFSWQCYIKLPCSGPRSNLQHENWFCRLFYLEKLNLSTCGVSLASLTGSSKARPIGNSCKFTAFGKSLQPPRHTSGSIGQFQISSGWPHHRSRTAIGKSPAFTVCFCLQDLGFFRPINAFTGSFPANASCDLRDDEVSFALVYSTSRTVPPLAHMIHISSFGKKDGNFSCKLWTRRSHPVSINI